MARYSKVDRRIYHDKKFRNLTSLLPSGQALWLYLLTNPFVGPIPGLYGAGEAMLSEALGWSIEDFRRCFAEIERQGMAKADNESRLVWIPNAIKYNEPKNPNIVISWADTWDELSECPLKQKARESLRTYCAARGEKFSEAFERSCPNGSLNSCGNHLANSLANDFGNDSGNHSANHLPNHLPNQEQEQEQEQDQNTNPFVADAPAGEAFAQPVQQQDPRHAVIRSLIQDLFLAQFQVKCQWDGSEAVAEMLGVTRRQLQNYVEQWGCPKHGAGRDSYYLWSEVRAWWKDYLLKINAPAPSTPEKIDLVEAQARKADVDGKRGEIKLARERREVVAIADVFAIVSQANSNVRSRVLQIPDKLTPKIASLGADKKRIKAVLKAEVLEALEELAKPAEVAQA